MPKPNPVRTYKIAPTPQETARAAKALAEDVAQLGDPVMTYPDLPSFYWLYMGVAYKVSLEPIDTEVFNTTTTER